uniref:Trehalase n=1 Tax=Romanomermis culicivorax TaxID=13658 RepID=A0A915IW69_ROMCU
MRSIVTSVIISILYSYCHAKDHVYPCDSQIYCQGPILEAVHDHRLFTKDNKDYVDMSLIKSPNDTLAAFYTAFPNMSGINAISLGRFIESHFLPPDLNSRNFESHIFTYAFQIKKDVGENPDKYSIINLPNPFIIPGGRFREIYYWDAYWILLGLFHSNMFNTARGMIENYLYLVETYGLIPNGGRVYYLQRSQPPFLAWMLNDYFEYTKDVQFVKRHVRTLEKELVNFWEKKRSFIIEMDNQTHRVFHYNTPTNTPRPESYLLDVVHTKNLPAEDKADLYSNIASSAESGWDFSSRWFRDKHNIRLQKTRTILPIDLNAIMCGNYKILARLMQVAEATFKEVPWPKMVGVTLFSLMWVIECTIRQETPERYERYYQKYEQCKKTIKAVFFNQTEGAWFDYHVDTEKHNTEFYPSNLTPLFADCYHFNSSDEYSIAMLKKYLNASKALQKGDGVPTSMLGTGQQWDWPNAWAPLVHMVVVGLHNTDHPELQEMANVVAEHWISHNYLMYWQTNNMYEKYDIVNNKVGTGGEYEVQEGFGWTNGVVLDLLVKYGSNFVFKQSPIQNTQTLYQRKKSSSTSVVIRRRDGDCKSFIEAVKNGRFLIFEVGDFFGVILFGDLYTFLRLGLLFDDETLFSLTASAVLKTRAMPNEASTLGFSGALRLVA